MALRNVPSIHPSDATIVAQLRSITLARRLITHEIVA
jgi:hypothetical protein